MTYFKSGLCLTALARRYFFYSFCLCTFACEYYLESLHHYRRLLDFQKKKLPILARCFLFSSCLCAAFRLCSGRLGQFFIHCFQQVLQKFSVVKVVQNEHFFGALIRNGGFRAFEKCLCGSRLLKQKTVDRRFRRPPCL